MSTFHRFVEGGKQLNSQIWLLTLPPHDLCWPPDGQEIYLLFEHDQHQPLPPPLRPTSSKLKLGVWRDLA